jgi:hypothetical protein
MNTRPPGQKAPALSCDSHFHIFGPFGKFPMDKGRTYTPPAALVPQYLQLAEALDLLSRPPTRCSYRSTQASAGLMA